jgi:hypothetical protein
MKHIKKNGTLELNAVSFRAFLNVFIRLLNESTNILKLAEKF